MRKDSVTVWNGRATLPTETIFIGAYGRKAVCALLLYINSRDKDGKPRRKMKASTKFAAILIAGLGFITVAASTAHAETRTDTIAYKGAWSVEKTQKADPQTLEIKVNYKVHLKDFDKTSKGGKTKARLVSCDKSLRSATNGVGGIRLVYKIGEDGSKRIAKAIK